jgi:hypothetical protein
MSITLNPVGDPIASIIDTNTGELSYVYLDREGVESNLLTEPLPDAMINIVEEQLRQGVSYNEVGNMLRNVKPEEEEKGVKNFTCEDYETIVLIPSKGNERLTMFGESGSGKSRLAAQYALQFHYMFPNRKIIIFCAQEEDPAFYNVEKDENGEPLRDEDDKLILVRDEHGDPIPLFPFIEFILGDSDDDLEALAETKINSFENSLCIFDDIDNIVDEKVRKKAHYLVNKCYSDGRKRNIRSVYLGHVAFAGLQNRTILQETSKYIFFPKTGADQIFKFFTNKMDMPAPKARQYANMKVDWLCLVRSAPRYFIFPSGIMVI